MELKEWIEKTLIDIKSLISLNNVDASTLWSLTERMIHSKNEYIVNSSIDDEGITLEIGNAQVDISKGNINGVVTITMPYHRVEEYIIDLEDVNNILADFYINFIKSTECA